MRRRMPGTVPELAPGLAHGRGISATIAPAMESARPYPTLNVAAAYAGSCIVLLMVSWSAWAAQGDFVPVDNWTEYRVGVLPVSGSGKWKIYSSLKVFKHPPSVVIDEDRRALLLKTDHETMAIGRSIQSLRQPP